MEKITLRDFWNANADSIKSLFLVGTACPAGIEYTANLEADGEDCCDLCELIDNLGYNLWEAEGEIDSEGNWAWDGNLPGVRDLKGNSYTRIEANVSLN